MVREPREQLVLDFLEDRWTAANTFGETPHISFGWFDDPPSKPYICVLQPEEGPIGGGETGFDGMDPNLGSPHQTIRGTVPVHVFATNRELDNASTDNPREYLTGSASRTDGSVSGGAIGEIYRIVRNNAVDPTNPKTGNTPVQLLSAGDAAPAPEEDETGVFHYLAPINYIYTTA